MNNNLGILQFIYKLKCTFQFGLKKNHISSSIRDLMSDLNQTDP